ncbi:hypothetical protein BDZ89DRAFT_1149385 [Hymenopellis radicata]|nr:hypothetical protein BDZ89DRAFT_1149385 [Hymenopellis radicata]
MVVRRVFGSLKASPQLSNCILHDSESQVGYRNRTGKKFRGHFDLWLSDEIVEITALLGVKPSFPLPRVLATRIATAETFGIQPLDTNLAEKLGITTLPRIRVHGTRRHPPHEAYKNVNFTLLAKFWNGEVDKQDRTVTDSNQRLYYKLPGQLEQHHKKTIMWKLERSTLFLGQNAVALTAFHDILSAENNSTLTLPAIPLPMAEADEGFRTVDEAQASLDKPSITPVFAEGGDEMDVDDPQDDDDPTDGNPLDDDSYNDMDVDIPSPSTPSQVEQPSTSQVQQPSASQAQQPSIVPAQQTSTSQVQQPSTSQSSPAPPSRQSTLQSTGVLSIASNPIASGSEKRTGDRCAVCCNAYCRLRWECPGKGNRKHCACPNHAQLRPGQKIRVSEEKIIAYLEAQSRAAQEGM